MRVACATLTAILCFTLSSAQSGKGNTNGRFKLTILHTNDIHSRILESDKRGMQCNEEKRKNGKCFGGIARIAYQVRKLKNAARNVLFVNAGDFYQGTLWYSILKHKIVSAAMSQMSYDVVCLGNHEFDDGPEGLAPFLRKMKEAKIRVLGTNLDTSAEPSFRDISLPRSTVYNIEGRQVAFLGVVTTETITIAKPGRIRILPEIESINNEIRRLKQQRINIFFLISHVGFDVDQKIAAACPDLDLIIGGHTNTFLYTGKPPVDDKPEGPYPVVYKRRDGTQCLIVQDFRFGKYLGYLRMEINRDGVITHWAGSPILLSQDVPQDLQVLNSMMPYKQTVDDAIKRTVGSTKVLLEADEKLCRYRECNSVNLMADSFLDFYANRNSPVSWAWSVVNAAVINGGIARDSIRQKSNVTLGDLLGAMPYDSDLVVMDMSGRDLYNMFEYGVSDFTWYPDLNGKFLQVSGAHVVYDFRQPNGRRVASLKVLCANCSVPVYKPVRKDQMYSIVTTSFIANGGDGFKFGSGVAKRTEGVSALDVFAKYFSKTSPVKTPEEERVIVLNLPKRGVGSP
ncbi:protein 5NUC-like isoform X1 [Dermacentor andersoni]|uniref:protein 5NUC-like isoform X1 n=1 Tax=Dermacentor andersoni TaxID=34620 RepID=UPI0021557004|nr:protein 5NUC-like isoform X1 [Dermacentor andersoni]